MSVNTKFIDEDIIGNRKKFFMKKSDSRGIINRIRNRFIKISQDSNDNLFCYFDSESLLNYLFEDIPKIYNEEDLITTDYNLILLILSLEDRDVLDKVNRKSIKMIKIIDKNYIIPIYFLMDFIELKEKLLLQDPIFNEKVKILDWKNFYFEKYEIFNANSLEHFLKINEEMKGSDKK